MQVKSKYTTLQGKEVVFLTTLDFQLYIGRQLLSVDGSDGCDSLITLTQSYHETTICSFTVENQTVQLCSAVAL